MGNAAVGQGGVLNRNFETSAKDGCLRRPAELRYVTRDGLADRLDDAGKRGSHAVEGRALGFLHGVARYVLVAGVYYEPGNFLSGAHIHPNFRSNRSSRSTAYALFKPPPLSSPATRGRKGGTPNIAPSQRYSGFGFGSATLGFLRFKFYRDQRLLDSDNFLAKTQRRQVTGGGPSSRAKERDLRKISPFGRNDNWVTFASWRLCGKHSDFGTLNL